MREEGAKGSYASYKTTVLMNAPFTAVRFAIHEAVKRMFMEIVPGNESEERLLVHLTAGAAAGALAGVVTTPLDVVETRLQFQIDNSVVESIDGGGKTCITARVYPRLAVGDDARIHVFNSGASAVSVSKLRAPSIWKACVLFFVSWLLAR